MIIPQTYVVFPSPVTLRLCLPQRRLSASAHEPVEKQFSNLPLVLRIDAMARTLTAYLPPIPAGLELYGPADFAAACADTMDEHVERVLQVLGSEPATVLQALIDGGKLPDPPQRVPREIANWRGKAVLTLAGHLPAAEAFIAALPEPQRTVARAAWDGDAKFSRSSQTVLALGQALSLSSADMDALFISANSIVI